MKRIGLIIILFTYVFYHSIDNAFSLQNQDSSRISFDTIITDNTHLFPFFSNTTISGLVLSVEINLQSDTSLVRIILMDNNYNEYLIYETYPMLAGSGQYSVDKAGEETFQLNNIIPYRVSFELIDGSIHLKEIIISERDNYKAESRADRLYQKSLDKIDRINQNIQKTGQKWIAGETSISKLSYQEKKRFFGGNVPNFQGFEYYTGGVFALPGAKNNLDSDHSQPAYLFQQEPKYASEFSWKNRHGQDWVTPVKNQGGCNSCWAFGTTAATELLVNLYYNRQLDYDLSEQNIISCTEGTCTEGGEPGSALVYARDVGIVLEDCFPYTASDQDSSGLCSNPLERFKIDHWTADDLFSYSVDDQKRKIINGAAAVSITPWKHFMQAVGYKVLEEGDNYFLADASDKVSDIDSTFWITLEPGNPLIGQTVWHCKNSWGEDWGDKGYVYLSNLTGNRRFIKMYSLYGPVGSLELNETDILCTDKDGDGYYCWGLGPKPIRRYCPDCPDEPDGDDSDPCIGPMDEFGILTHYTPTPDAEDSTVLIGQMVPDLCATGTNIRWYSDNKLANLVHNGNTFPTGHTETGDYTYYVTQTLSGCESAANAVTLSIWPEIPHPLGHGTEVYEGEPSILTVTGEEGAVFKWYEDPLLTVLLHTGDSFDTQKTDPGSYTFYVTQTLWQSESAPDTVVLTISPYFVSIPDPAFLHALIEEGVDINRDGLISYPEAEAVKRLYIWGKDISSLKGLEAFLYLTHLDCSNNKLTSLDISKNPKLRMLSCAKNHLKSLDFTKHYSLAVLDCSYNELTSLNLSYATMLHKLWCHHNLIRSLDVSTTPMGEMFCYNNPLISLNISRCRFLKRLFCGNSKLTSLDVSQNEYLEDLNISNIPDLSQVCVWEMPFPPENVYVDTSGSPKTFYTTDCTMGLDEYQYGKFNIYPNPVNDLLTIEIRQPGQNFIEITSLNGQLLYTYIMEGSFHQIDLSSFEKGLYFITVRSRDDVRTEKIVKR